MLRTAVLTTLAVWVTASSALAIGPRLEAFRVQGYVDRAPADVRVLDRLEVGRGESARTIFVTESVPVAGADGCASCDALYDMRSRYDVVGDRGDVERLLETPVGAKISAVLTRPRADRHLLVQDVDADDSKSVADAVPSFDPQG